MLNLPCATFSPWVYATVPSSSHLPRDHRGRIPFLLMTNGGGMTEEKKAERLSERLGFEVTRDEVSCRGCVQLKILVCPANARKVVHLYNDHVTTLLLRRSWLTGDFGACRLRL